MYEQGIFLLGLDSMYTWFCIVAVVVLGTSHADVQAHVTSRRYWPADIPIGSEGLVLGWFGEMWGGLGAGCLDLGVWSCLMLLLGTCWLASECLLVAGGGLGCAVLVLLGKKGWGGELYGCCWTLAG